jgi:hypothetical protein
MQQKLEEPDSNSPHDRHLSSDISLYFRSLLPGRGQEEEMAQTMYAHMNR